MNDKQIIERPKCAKCKTEPALTLFGEYWICGGCMLKRIEEKKSQDRAWIEG